MLNIITKPVPIDDELKKRITYACKFANIVPKIVNGYIRHIILIILRNIKKR